MGRRCNFSLFLALPLLHSRVPFETAIQILKGHLQERPQRPASADVVDGGGELVAGEVSPVVGNGPEGGRHRGRVGGVGGDAEGAAAGAVDLGDEVLEAVLATGEENDGVGLGEALGLYSLVVVWCLVADFWFGSQVVDGWRFNGRSKSSYHSTASAGSNACYHREEGL